MCPETFVIADIVVSYMGFNIIVENNKQKCLS